MDPFRRCLELAWQSCVEGLEPVEGTTLAHAEINALVKLRRRTGGHMTCTLWTSLEPCVQCAAAFAAMLPLHFADDLVLSGRLIDLAARRVDLDTALAELADDLAPFASAAPRSLSPSPSTGR